MEQCVVKEAHPKPNTGLWLYDEENRKNKYTTITKLFFHFATLLLTELKLLLLLNSARSFNIHQVSSIYMHTYFEDQIISKLLQLKLCNVGFWVGGRGESAVKE